MSTVEKLLEIMARLRDPAGGCPWDLEQDFASISPHTIEEAYEVDQAIEQGDLEALRDELGDLLFQVVFQARLAEERGAFDFAGVVDAIEDKLIRRHPHVFADLPTPPDAEGQRLAWESLKAAERDDAAPALGPADSFVGIPRKLPALARAAKIAGRIARLEPGGDAPDPEALADALVDRVLALRESLVAEPPPRADLPVDDAAAEQRARRAEWVGRGLQHWVRLARALGVDPEQALRRADDATIERTRIELASSQASESKHR